MKRQPAQLPQGCERREIKGCWRQPENAETSIRHILSADTLEELYELLEALICCCYRAGIISQLHYTDTKLYLHHKDALKRLFLEVNVSDVGWGVCAYQILFPYDGDQSEPGRMRIGDTGPRNIIQWISKAWTANDLTLPVFYRELATCSNPRSWEI